MQKTKAIGILILTLIIVIQISCTKKIDLSSVDCNAVTTGYSSDIQPLVQNTCSTTACHDKNSKNGDFTTYSGLKSAVDEGLIEKRVLDKQNMPPTGSLTFEELKKIKCWLDSGSPND